MKITANLWLLNKARYNLKVKKLCRQMAECMDEEGVLSCAESTAKVLQLLPESMREGLIDKLIHTLDETRERLENMGERSDEC